MAGGGRKATVVSAAALVVLLVAAAAAGTAEAGFTMCGVGPSAVEACRSYCTVGSTDEKPSSECCAAVQGANFKCLCNNKNLLRKYENIDADRATKIPSMCGVPYAGTSCK
uniref:Bifunctional inhibitor/plant lipid transfer protein/seed storage helical domain-containing protein n=1 Tax=Leersia perrieri TaxID=77586 RepID=A0A0D9V9F7_9ORYZ